MEKQWFLVFYACLVFSASCFSLTFNQYDDYDINSPCHNSGSPGTCKDVRYCSTAMNSLRKFQKHNLKRCYFQDKNEIVCCPKQEERSSIGLEPFTEDDSSSREQTSRPVTNNNRQTFKRKFEQACEDIQAESRTNIVFHIIGGENAVEKEFPHMAALGYEDSSMKKGDLDWKCGASVISPRFLLTAAHCVIDQKPTKARLGITKLDDSNRQDINIKNVTVHEDYDPFAKHGDIAVVELMKNITFGDKVQPACLYPRNDDPLGLLVTGWGKTSIQNEDDRSLILQKANLVSVPVDDCNNTYTARSLGTKMIKTTQICAWAKASDACWGDSGGPLQKKEASGVYSIVGIVSYGAGCGGKIPGVYTRVSKFIDWIEKHVWS